MIASRRVHSNTRYPKHIVTKRSPGISSCTSSSFTGRSTRSTAKSSSARQYNFSIVLPAVEMGEDGEGYLEARGLYYVLSKNSIFRLLFSISSRDSDKGRNYKSPSISDELVVLLYLLCFCTDGGVDGQQMKLRRAVGGLLGCVVRRVNGDPYSPGSINGRRSEGSNVRRRYTAVSHPSCC